MIACAVLAALSLPAVARADAQVQLDPATDTVRVAASPDGTLTGPAAGAAAPIGLKYVRKHRARLGLKAADLDTLTEPTVTSAGGIRQVRWRQHVDGIPVADAELRVNVDADGRVINVLGSPSSSLPEDTTPLLAKPQPDAELTIHSDRLAYRYREEAGPDAIYDTITDADTGKVLKRTNLVKSVDGRVWEHYPGAPFGGTAELKSLDRWLLPGVTTRLEGPYVHTLVDINGTGAGTNVAPGDYPLVSNWPAGLGCSPVKLCSWDGSNTSRATNRNQNAVQAFYLANRFRDHLAAPPIGFDGFSGPDKIRLETNNGASAVNNANMFTPPEGEQPLMQMYFWHGGAGFRSVNSGDDASILFHEYTHGLSGRLVTDADGVQALGSWQAGAMGEGWSDFYAKDYLVTNGYETDTPAAGEIDMGVYTDAAPHKTRSAGIDCPVGSGCPGGGYTYGDFAKIVNGPEVHYDGEIWAQTLWDLRTAMAAPSATLAIVTQAMRLSPPEPSFLDMRNAILQADTALFDSAHHATIWAVFANRGMGWDASTVDGADTRPVEGRALPPAGGPLGTLTGTITDGAAPIAGATVSIGARTATTDAGGRYSLANLPAQTYAHAVVSAPGYDRLVLDDVAVPGEADAQLRRNWASVRGGATATAPTGDENAPIGCGPKQAVDGLQSSTWSTQQGVDKPLVVKLPGLIDITGLAIDPSAGCGDGVGSSMGTYTVEAAASAAGPWTQIAAGTFGAAHRGKLNPLTASASGAQYVRLTPMTTQTPSAMYIDVSEFSVYGVSHGPAPQTTLLSGPSGIESDPRPTFTFSSDQPGSTFRCRLDGGWVPCASPYRPATPLTNGQTYTFEVYAVNQYGTADLTPESRTFTINSELPTTTLLTKPAALTTAATATFTFTGNGSTFECRRDGGAFTPCTSPEAWAVSEGERTFAVRAVNALGPDPSPETFTFTVDRSAPVTTITSATADADAATFAFSSADLTPVTYLCTFRGQTAPCTSPQTYGGLPDGDYPFTVVATDALGHATTQQATVRVAPAPFETQLTAAPGALINRPEAEFAFSSPSAGARFQCSLDAAPFTACTSPLRLAGLADGAHTLAVRAVGPGTRVDPTPARATFTVDTGPPETIIAWAPPPVLTTRDFALGFAASEPATFVCSVDGAAAVPCASPLQLAGLRDGAHTVVVTAIDAAGNADPTPARTDFTVMVPALPPAPRPTVTPTPAPKRALTSAVTAKSASLKQLRRTGKLKITLRSAAGARVTVKATLGSRSLGTARRTRSGAFQLTLSKSRLRTAKAGNTVVVRVQASGSGLRTVTRTLKVRLRA